MVSAERPVVRLSWARATGAADEFIVYRNGVQVARFDGGEFQATSTTWRWEDWSVEPNRESVYKVHAVVAGTPNLLEFDQGFFVKGGDGLSDVKPIAGMYKQQVYALARYLQLPSAIANRAPTTETFLPLPGRRTGGTAISRRPERYSPVIESGCANSPATEPEWTT